MLSVWTRFRRKFWSWLKNWDVRACEQTGFRGHNTKFIIPWITQRLTSQRCNYWDQKNSVLSMILFFKLLLNNLSSLKRNLVIERIGTNSCMG